MNVHKSQQNSELHKYLCDGESTGTELTAPQERSCYLFPGTAENGTQGLVLALALTLPCLILVLPSLMCLQGEVCRCSNCTVWSQQPIHGRVGHNGTWLFLLPFWFLYYLIQVKETCCLHWSPPNKSPCHHSFPMLLCKLPRIAVTASPHSTGVVPSSSPFLFPYFLGVTVSVFSHYISFCLLYMFVQSISRLPFRDTCACVCAHMWRPAVDIRKLSASILTLYI